MASYGGGASEYGDRISLEPARGGRGGGCVLRGGRPLGDLASMLAMRDGVSVSCCNCHGQWRPGAFIKELHV